jgi:hypothetical protein
MKKGREMFDPSILEASVSNIFISLIKCFTDIDQIIVAQNSSSERVQYYKHEFFKKMFRHVVSAQVLSPGTLLRFSDIEFQSKDIAAINLIVRSSLEAFLLFHYIYIDSGSAENVEFRFHSWWREGLLTRIEYSLPGVDVESVKKRDRDEIAEIEKKLSINPAYLQLTKEQKKSFDKKGNWKWLGWKEMLGRTKFNKPYKDNIYSFLSSYAHSESVGMVQVRSMEHENRTDEFIKTSMIMLAVVNAVFLEYYCEDASIIDRRMPQSDVNFIETWSYLGTGEPQSA